MKVAIGFNLVSGPWGGGNQFAKALSNELEKRGHKVCFDLIDRDIDIILLTDPRKNSKSVSFGAGSILKYLLTKNRNSIVVHRINECDERKNTRFMNIRLKLANYASDFNVFIANWLMDLSIYEKKTPKKVIMNGANNKLFNNNNSSWNSKDTLKIVTHHWGGNYMKGFDVYQKLDKLVKDKSLKTKLKFTYIGNLPKNISFQNSTHLEPLEGKNLAKELSKHHIYITGTINEPAGMHHIEGALSGLPILYRDSGALPEYCNGYGFKFYGDNFLPALKKMIKNYPKIAKNLKKYPYTADKMCKEYIFLFEKLIRQRNSIISKRKLFRNPMKLFFNIFFL